MPASPLASAVLFHLGPVAITRPVVTTWAIIAVLALGCRLVTRRLALHPGRRQAVVELIVTGIMGQIEDVIRKNAAALPAAARHAVHLPGGRQSLRRAAGRRGADRQARRRRRRWR